MRYVRLLGVQLRASITVAMQYRVNFLVDGALSLFWLSWTIVPLLIVFRGREQVAGWSLPEAELVFACFTILRGLLEGAINPSLVQVSEQIRSGTLDFVLIKPADAQFLISTAKFATWKIVDILGGIGLAVHAFISLGRAPALIHLAAAASLLVASILVLYAICILVVSASFFVIRLDNLIYLISSVFDAARWPLAVFRGFWRILFTFVLPIGIMTTYPAQAILGTLDARSALIALAGAMLFTGIARLVWLRAIGHYTSASS
jgi:ABC-2 type transport system permease protein